MRGMLHIGAGDETERRLAPCTDSADDHFGSIPAGRHVASCLTLYVSAAIRHSFAVS